LCQQRLCDPAAGRTHAGVPLLRLLGGSGGRPFATESTPSSGEEAQQDSATSDAAKEEGETASAEASEEEVQLPRVLWKAPALAKEMQATEHMLGVSAMATGSGLGMALLGIAPFTPPNPFMFGLFLAVMQVRLAHIWMTRQMRAQVRRHVTELVQVEGSLDADSKEALVIRMTSDGGLVRTLHLVAPDGEEKKPPFSDVTSQGCTFVFFDRGQGKSDFKEALDAVLDSERVIQKEELEVTPFEEESQLEADKMVQRLTSLTREHLKGLKGKDEVAPAASLGQIRRSSQLSGAVILSAGVVIGIGGRIASEQPQQPVAA